MPIAPPTARSSPPIMVPPTVPMAPIVPPTTVLVAPMVPPTTVLVAPTVAPAPVTRTPPTASIPLPIISIGFVITPKAGILSAGCTSFFPFKLLIDCIAAFFFRLLVRLGGLFRRGMFRCFRLLGGRGLSSSSLPPRPGGGGFVSLGIRLQYVTSFFAALFILLLNLLPLGLLCYVFVGPICMNKGPVCICMNNKLKCESISRIRN
mmetsp:Transcript_1620/g.3376  ORF Transcript_1620/g.3376 Transcript_1620/m.3376 type:complete len:206 (+) Transcript_1620:4272-4889(+)